jgi:hypothetical protein
LRSDMFRCNDESWLKLTTPCGSLNLSLSLT